MINLFTNPDLFRVIDTYTDLRSLCDTCTVLSTLKKYIFYLFNKNYSLMYHDDISFRNRVLSKIFNPNKQLHLQLSDSGYRITDVSALGNVHTLDLGDCEITDVSALGNVHTLNLCICKNITDVSALGNVHDLNLRGCDKITDVSMLGNVHTLDIRNCKNITDVSFSAIVRNVHTLKTEWW